MSSVSSTPTAAPAVSKIDPATITFSRNFTPEQRAAVATFANVIIRDKVDCFGASTGARLALTEVETRPRDEDGKLQARVVFEADVAPDMLNPAGRLHGACSMYLIDVCSTIALHALGIAQGKRVYCVSQALNTVFHAPTHVGSRIRVVNYTTSLGTRTISARVEIWDITNRRLVTTGVHSQMPPTVVDSPKL